jgi:hypothetical protein
MTKVIPVNNDKELDKYGLGTVRTVEQWQEFSGFNLLTGKITPKGSKGNYHEVE